MKGLTMNHEQIFNNALEAGREAFKACTPQAMVVTESDLRGNPIGRSWVVNEGVCGFAEVRIKGNTSFGRRASKTKSFRKSYEGGLYYWVSENSQSLERKEAFAHAMARYLTSMGIEAYSTSRLD